MTSKSKISNLNKLLKVSLCAALMLVSIPVFAGHVSFYFSVPAQTAYVPDPWVHRYIINEPYYGPRYYYGYHHMPRYRHARYVHPAYRTTHAIFVNGRWYYSR